MKSQLGQVGCAVEKLGGVGKKMSGYKSGNTNAEQRQGNFMNAIEGKLRVQSRASEILQDQITEEINEMEHKRKEEALELVRKENDSWRYQNEKEEAKRLQGARKQRKDEEMVWAPPRTCRIGLTGKRREVRKKACGGWSQREKRRCQRSLSCRMRSKALTWTLMAKATASRQKQISLEEKYQAKRVRRTKVRKEK